MVPMNESSTLVYLVHQINTEMAKLRGFREGEPDEQVSLDSNAPSALSVRKILDFAHVLQVEETESMGKVEWLLN
jgi:hypothetical protein